MKKTHTYTYNKFVEAYTKQHSILLIQVFHSTQLERDVTASNLSALVNSAGLILDPVEAREFSDVVEEINNPY